MNKLRFALFGTGFWSRYQLAGWMETGGVECVALYNRTLPKAEALAKEFGIPAVYDDPKALLNHEQIDFMDICTAVETHADLTRMGADRGLKIFCQKPMATTLAEAESMVAYCQERKVPLFINENWRWQYPIRQFKRILEEADNALNDRGRTIVTSDIPEVLGGIAGGAIGVGVGLTLVFISGIAGCVQRAVIELKLLYVGLEATLVAGIERTWAYADASGAGEAHLMIFDRTPGRLWAEKV